MSYLLSFWCIRKLYRIQDFPVSVHTSGNWSSNWDWRCIWHSFCFSSDDGTTCELCIHVVFYKKANIKHVIAKKIREATGLLNWFGTLKNVCSKQPWNCLDYWYKIKMDHYCCLPKMVATKKLLRWLTSQPISHNGGQL